MKICIEGPSAVGKSTLAKLLKDDFYVLPEVNLLFERPESADKYWYLKRQVERHQIAKKYENVIFDGDLFQPLWYSWTYDYPPEFLNQKELHNFYGNMIVQGYISFPDVYIILNTSMEELWNRKNGDEERARRGFTKHLKLVESIPFYFRAMKSMFNTRVIFLESSKPEKTKRKFFESIQEVTENLDSREIFDFMNKWLLSTTFES